MQHDRVDDAVPPARGAADEERLDLPAVLDQLRAVQRSQEFLLRASDVLARAEGFLDTVEALARIAVPDLGDLCLIDILDRGGDLRRVVALHADPSRQPLADELQRSFPPLPGSAHPGARSIATGRSHWSPTMTDEFLVATTYSERHYALVKELEFTGYISVPLIADGAVLGGVTLVVAGSGRTFTPRDLTLAEDLASRVALVVAKAQRYDNDHRAAHLLQLSLLPPSPESAVVDVAVRYLPGNDDAEVGGDFYDLLHLPSGKVAFTVGDVAGHDLTAAAAMGQLRSAYRALTVHATDPSSMVAALHASWPALGVRRTATALFGELDPATGVLTVASAGHPCPLLLTADAADFLEIDPGAPLGAPPTEAPLWRGELEPGDVLICFTDGLVEDRSRDIDVGMAALLEAALAATDHTPDVLADEILAALTGTRRSDDVAMLVLRRRPLRGRS